MGSTDPGERTQGDGDIAVQAWIDWIVGVEDQAAQDLIFKAGATMYQQLILVGGGEVECAVGSYRLNPGTIPQRVGSHQFDIVEIDAFTVAIVVATIEEAE